jgi:solute:Na+ symporter, SSS family
MLTIYDEIVIGFYLLFMVSVGFVFKRFIKNTSDYFRSGGQMVWWIVGAGVFMTSFSAVVFTGMAGKAYDDGPVVLVIFVANAIGFFFNYLYFAPVFRQMRCVTAMQAVRKRFGPVNEQFFTWIQIVTGMLYAAIWLNGLGVVVSAAFNLPLATTIIIAGSVVVLVAALGGSWSTTASEFVQMLLLMPVTLTVACLALIKIGGVGNFVQQVPSHFWHWGEVANRNIIILWVVAMLLQKWTNINNLSDAARYLSVKDTRHARKAALLATALFCVGPIIWFIPPMVARITHSPAEMHALYPTLANPQEGGYIVMAKETMPVGMLGLLFSGIFSATMSSMDTGLNRNAGYFVKNFYQVILRPKARERELMLASVITTLLLGFIIIMVGLLFASWKDLTIFRLMVNFGGWVALPITVPLIWGMFIRKAPSWAGWSAVLAGLTSSYLTNRYLSPGFVHRFFGLELNPREASDWAQLAGILMNLCVGSAWFLCSTIFADERPVEEVERVDSFFKTMRTPIDFEREEGPGSDNLQTRVMGVLCMVYGGFILLMLLIPQESWTQRIPIAFCGGCMGFIGLILRSRSRAPVRVEEQSRADQPLEVAAAQR